MNKGFVILAQNTKSVNYIQCAEMLAYSLKKHMPNLSVTLISSNHAKSKYFDNVLPLPYGDLEPVSDWKLINDWQIYEASPYDYTIKLEADLFITKPIDYWFDILQNRDVVVSTTIRNFHNKISDCLVYRKFIVDNNLPNVYNAITYFKKSKLAEKFFMLVRNIFENWEKYISILKCNFGEPVTTDWVYAIACHILGKENTTLPSFTDMSMIHMKKFVNNLFTEDWQNELVYECLPNTLRINTVPQMYPFHYHRKDFSEELKLNYLWSD